MLAGPNRFKPGLLGGLRHLNHGDWVATNSEIDAKKTYFHNLSLSPPLRGESRLSNSTSRFFSRGLARRSAIKGDLVTRLTDVVAQTSGRRSGASHRPCGDELRSSSPSTCQQSRN